MLVLSYRLSHNFFGGNWYWLFTVYKLMVPFSIIIISSLFIITHYPQIHEPIFPSIHLIPNSQSMTTLENEEMLHEIYSQPACVYKSKQIAELPQKNTLYEERPEVKINSTSTVQKTVKSHELHKTENEEMTDIRKPQQATTKTPDQGNTSSTTPAMGDTRIVNGQKQVYFLGFGWIEDDNKPNEEITAKDMLENGNKVGNMEGSTVMDSDGDIDKMVGTMGN